MKRSKIAIIFIETVTYNWRGFVLSFVLVMLMTIFQQLDFHPLEKILSPVSDEIRNSANVMDEIVLPKLMQIKNSYRLKTSGNSIVPQAAAAPDLNLDVAAYLLVDFDSGDVLAEKNPEKILPIASLTKIMAAIVALDLSSPDEYFTVSDYASRQIPTRIGVIPGQELRLSELLDALLLTSANDAAQVIQEGIDSKYSKPVFIEAMNEKARIIGLHNTSFANPQGFDDPANYSTASDLAILSHYALSNYPEIEEIVKKDYTFLPKDRHHKQFDLYNWNGLIGTYPAADGIKIGNTEEAGKTTIVRSNRGGKKLLAIILGANGLYERDLSAADLLDEGYKMTLNLPKIGLTKGELQKKYNSWYPES